MSPEEKQSLATFLYESIGQLAPAFHFQFLCPHQTSEPYSTCLSFDELDVASQAFFYALAAILGAQLSEARTRDQEDEELHHRHSFVPACSETILLRMCATCGRTWVSTLDLSTGQFAPTWAEIDELLPSISHEPGWDRLATVVTHTGLAHL